MNERDFQKHTRSKEIFSIFVNISSNKSREIRGLSVFTNSASASVASYSFGGYSVLRYWTYVEGIFVSVTARCAIRIRWTSGVGMSMWTAMSLDASMSFMSFLMCASCGRVRIKGKGEKVQQQSSVLALLLAPSPSEARLQVVMHICCPRRPSRIRRARVWKCPMVVHASLPWFDKAPAILLNVICVWDTVLCKKRLLVRSS